MMDELKTAINILLFLTFMGFAFNNHIKYIRKVRVLEAKRQSDTNHEEAVKYFLRTFLGMIITVVVILLNSFLFFRPE